MLISSKNLNLSNDFLAPTLSGGTATATTIPLSWTLQSGSSPVDKYRVSYSYTIRGCGSGPVSDSEEINDGNSRSFTLTDLEEDSDYTITLTAVRGDEASNSNPVSKSTSTSGMQKKDYSNFSYKYNYYIAPSGIPQSLSLSAVNLTSITVQWTELPCSDRNGEITGYTVEYSSTRPPHTGTVTVSGSSTTRLVVGGLLPRTNYTFSVRAVGADDMIGPSASQSSFTSTPSG